MAARFQRRGERHALQFLGLVDDTSFLRLPASIFHLSCNEFTPLVASIVLGGLAALLLMNYLGIAISKSSGGLSA
jgi:hypothetical protein